MGLWEGAMTGRQVAALSLLHERGAQRRRAHGIGIGGGSLGIGSSTSQSQSQSQSASIVSTTTNTTTNTTSTATAKAVGSVTEFERWWSEQGVERELAALRAAEGGVGAVVNPLHGFEPQPYLE